jgi:hypothetical protein
MSNFASEESEKPSGTAMATRDVLLKLGFTTYQAEITDKQPGYKYNFGNIILKAYQLTNLTLRPVMQFSGFSMSPDKFRVTEIYFDIPMEVETYELGVAYIAYYLESSFKPKFPTPWLEQGRDWKELLPWRRRMRLYEARPQCYADADWFRVAVKKLLACGERADDDQLFEVSCFDEILRFKMDGQTVSLPIRGKD